MKKNRLQKSVLSHNYAIGLLSVFFVSILIVAILLFGKITSVTTDTFLPENHRARNPAKSPPPTSKEAMNNIPTISIAAHPGNGFRRIRIKPPLNISIDIPDSATYDIISHEGEDWGINLYYGNIHLGYCTGCNWLGEECGGMMLENCSQYDHVTGDFILTENVLKTNNNYLVRVTSNIDNLYAETLDHQRLTQKEMDFIIRIKQSISRN